MNRYCTKCQWYVTRIFKKSVRARIVDNTGEGGSEICNTVAGGENTASTSINVASDGDGANKQGVWKRTRVVEATAVAAAGKGELDRDHNSDPNMITTWVI